MADETEVARVRDVREARARYTPVEEEAQFVLRGQVALQRAKAALQLVLETEWRCALALKTALLRSVRGALQSCVAAGDAAETHVHALRTASSGGRFRAAEDATNGLRRAVEAMEAAADTAVAALDALIAADVPRQPIARA